MMSIFQLVLYTYVALKLLTFSVQIIEWLIEQEVPVAFLPA